MEKKFGNSGNNGVAEVIILDIDIRGSYAAHEVGPMILLKLTYKTLSEDMLARYALLQMEYSNFCRGGVTDIEHGRCYRVIFNGNGQENEVLKIELRKAEN
jgi:hypothetical protein